MKKINNYVKDLYDAVIDLDVEKFREHWKKYQYILPTIPRDEVLQVMMHKIVLARTDMPAEVQEKAKKWLTDHGYSENIE